MPSAPSWSKGLALALALLPAASHAQSPRDAGAAVAAPTLSSLLARFAALPGLSARYTEEKRMALLAVPLRSEGTLDFAPPGRMLRRTTSPTAGFALISGSRLEFGDDHQRQRVDLDAVPAARQFVDSFLSLVAGDQAALARAYEMDFRADPRRPDGWELALVPRLPATRRVFAQIALRGAGVVIERMTLRETNGDETVTTFRDVDPARRYTPAELARLFGPEGR